MLRALAELIRLPNIFTSIADVAMGFLFVREFAADDAWLLGILVAASALLYAGGTTLNDVFDYMVDLEQRPERPLPSGRIRRNVGRWLGIEFLVLGAAAAWLASYFHGNLLPGVVGTLLVGCILLYDGWAKRTPLGPLAMGGCRMFNVLLGMSVADFVWNEAHWIVALGLGLYVTGITWFARTESRFSNRWQLAAATAVMLSGIGLLGTLPEWFRDIQPLLQAEPSRWYLLMGMLAMLIGWRCVRAVAEPRPYFVQTAVRQAIMSIVVLDAALTFAARDLMASIAVLLLLIPTLAAGTWFEST
jgi:4-hydroxybenzoate polyprenyltransferase